MGCTVRRIALGARNALLQFLVRERDAAGKLVPVPLDAATTGGGYVQGAFRKPSGAFVIVELVVASPASDGVAYYLTAPGFLDEAGLWEAQAHVHLDGAPAIGRGYFPSEIVTFEVVAQLRPFSPADEPFPVGPLVLGLELPPPLVA